MTPSGLTPFRAFTVKFSGRVRRITTMVSIGPPVAPGSPEMQAPIFDSTALWDTGATHSVITASTAARLNLPPTGVATISHAGGTSHAKKYVVSVTLPNHVRIAAVEVTECPDTTGQFNAIIGMDVIGMGDLSISNFEDKTWMTFRIPSIETVDFVQEADRLTRAAVGRNDLCPCGSGRKFKKCCGR